MDGFSASVALKFCRDYEHLFYKDDVLNFDFTTRINFALKSFVTFVSKIILFSSILNFSASGPSSERSGVVPSASET